MMSYSGDAGASSAVGLAQTVWRYCVLGDDASRVVINHQDETDCFVNYYKHS